MAAASRIFFTVPDPPARANSLWVADLPPGLAIEDGRAEERVAGDSAMTFKVRLSRKSPDEVLVSYETEADTADAGADFVPAKGTLRFARGERVKLIRVSVVSDARTEGEERFRLRLTAPVGAEIDRGLATGTIRDPRAGLPDLRP
jgi:hypothetical protein